MILPDFLTQIEQGEIVLTGHRIGLYHIVDYYEEGFSPEMLVEQFPTLPLSLVHKVIAFYLDNRAEVEVYAAACRAKLEEQRQAGKHLDVAKLRSTVAKWDIVDYC